MYDAWYEMYPANPVNFPNTVRPGDHMSASVTYNGGSSYTLKISDSTEGWNQSTNQSLSGAPNSSAEVIVEAPCCTALGGLLPLAHFSTGTAARAAVTEGSTAGTISSFPDDEITMVDSAGRVEAQPGALNSSGNSFTVTWERSS